MISSKGPGRAPKKVGITEDQKVANGLKCIGCTTRGWLCLAPDDWKGCPMARLCKGRIP
jgi:hypothetical protein